VFSSQDCRAGEVVLEEGVGDFLLAFAGAGFFKFTGSDMHQFSCESYRGNWRNTKYKLWNNSQTA
jgi:hypothetical protein